MTCRAALLIRRRRDFVRRDSGARAPRVGESGRERRGRNGRPAGRKETREIGRIDAQVHVVAIVVGGVDSGLLHPGDATGEAVLREFGRRLVGVTVGERERGR